MLRFHPIANAKAAEAYYTKSDGGYYLGDKDLGCEWLGKGADMLGLKGRPDFEQFKRLIRGLDPHTGEQITTKPRTEEGIPGWDVTASVPKGVTVALERGDGRVQGVISRAKTLALADLERYATTRVRKGGEQDDRLTNNLVAYAVEHPETRPAKGDGLPDMDRHWHIVVMNLTFDPVEKEWKAVKFRQIMDLRKYFDRRFDMYVAKGMTDLGYRVETKYKSDGAGGKRYFSWDIGGMPQSLVQKFSRRTAEVEKLAAELHVESPTGKDKLGATSRQHKRTDMTLEDYRRYWDGRVTDDEARQVAETIKAAMTGQNPPPQNTAERGVAFALGHQFERRSVVPLTELEITAYERSMGGAVPEQIGPELVRQGMLVKDGEATTRGVLAEEAKIIAFAREGRGTCRPLGVGERLPAGLLPPELPSGTAPQTETATLPALGQQKGRPDESRRPSDPAFHPVATPDTATLSPEQQTVLQDHFRDPAKMVGLSPEQLRLAQHVWTSHDRLILIRGAAGTGKTTAMKATIAGIDAPVVVLAPSADASRGVLRGEGFQRADTVAAFLGSKDMQRRAANGVIWIDEAGQLPIRDLSRLTDVATAQNARIVLQGDPKQHRSVARDGNMFHVLQQYAGLPVAELKDIKRQKGRYREAVALIDRGEFVKAHDTLDELGYIRQVPVWDHNKPLVDDYLDAVRNGKSVLVVAPTHREGDEITAEIRKRLKEEGKIGDEEREFTRLVPLNLSEAQRTDPASYEPGQVASFFRASGAIKAGQRVPVTGDRIPDLAGRGAKLALYGPDRIRLALGDTIRTTANVKDTAGKRIDNGTFLTVAGFTDKAIEVVTPSGQRRFLPASVGHIQHGYVSTSHASQGKTVDVVLGAMGSESLPAINAEQFYVTASRGRERFTLYTDLSPAALREAIQKQDRRKSATELVGEPRPSPRRRALRDRALWLVRRARSIYKSLRERSEQAMADRQQERHLGYAR
jgi:conjugative relaxase-like TrwC/TraI family protein